MPLYCECAYYRSPVIVLPYANNFGNHSLFVAVGRGWGIFGDHGVFRGKGRRANNTESEGEFR